MDKGIPLGELAGEIASLYRVRSADSEPAIERLLQQRLRALPPLERLAAVEEMAREFEGPVTPSGTSPEEPLRAEEVSRLLALFLGEKVSVSDLSPEELLPKLTHALNTVFDSLNQIISVINFTLAGGRVEIETIRHVIGSHLRGGQETDTLKGYLDQIQEAFLVAHRSFKEAALRKIGEILAELDPDHIDAEAAKGLKFGALRKADLFDLYKEKFQSCKGWVESGRLSQELLREFESLCQKSYKRKKGVVL